MKLAAAIGLVIALVSTTLTNLAYSREHDAAADLPVLQMRRPIHSARLLIADRAWMRAFGLETGGFALYATALALAPLSLVQSVAAGGIGVLAFVSARSARRRLSNRELLGAGISVLGLLALAVSLSGSGEGEGNGALRDIVIWLGASALLAAAVLSLGAGRLGSAAAHGIAGGILFSVGDISTKLATDGGVRVAFLVTLVLGYMLGTSLLQIGYQAGGAVTVAGLATLLTNALPIIAGTVILKEPVPGGALGVLRALSFAGVTIGAVLLARPDPRATRNAPARAGPGRTAAAAQPD